MTDSRNDPYTLTFFTAHSGAESVRLDRHDGTSLHLHSLVDPEREADYFANIQCWGDRLICAGCGLGYHLRGVISTVPEGTSILLVDYYGELTRRTLKHLPDKVRPKVTVISNNDVQWEDRVADFLAGGRYVQVVKHPASFRAHEQFYRAILQKVSGSRTNRKQTGTFIMMQGGFFLEEELLQAGKECGKSAIPFRYKKNESVQRFEHMLQKTVQKEHPEGILSVNMLGFDGNGYLSDYTKRSGIPVAVWFVDDPRPILLNQRQYVTDNMIAFTWERSYIPWLKRQGFSSVRWLPLATDPTQFVRKSGADVTVTCGFIGSSMGQTFLSEIAAKFIWDEAYRIPAEKVARRILITQDTDVDALIKAGCRQFAEMDDHNLTWLRSYIIHTASMLKRKQIIEALTSRGVETFGDPEGWKRLCGDSVVTHPDLDYRTEVADRYRSIAVNLNITSRQMSTAVNQRVFDVPACGAFLLTDYQSDLEELFSPGEYEVYRSVEELQEKVSQYSGDRQAGRLVTDAARTRIINEHTYSHRLQSILTQLHSR